MKTPKTTPVKNMPTHGPGTYAFYRGSKCKILSIGGGKAKIMVNGQIKLVNYTSLDDEMYGTGTNLPINESEKQDAYQEFFKNKLKDYGVESPSEPSDEDKSKFFSEIKSEWKGGINEAVKLLQHRGIEPAGLMVPAVNVDGEVGVIFGGTFKIKEAAKAKKIEAQLKALGIKPAEFGGGYDDLMYEIDDGTVEIDDKEVICYMIIDNKYQITAYCNKNYGATPILSV